MAVDVLLTWLYFFPYLKKKKRLPSIGRSGVYGNFYGKLHNLTALFTLMMDDDLLDVPGQLLEYSNSEV